MLITLFFAFINLFTPNQPKWEDLTAFEIYSKVGIDKFHQMTEADIQKLPFKTANLNDAKKLLSAAKQTFGPVIWKGMGRIAIAKFKDGSTCKILINTFGSTFRDVTGKTNYSLEGKTKEWQDFISKNKPREIDTQ